MFRVKQVRSGLLWDEARVVATSDASHRRGRLGWDRLGAPTLLEEVASVRRGDEFAVTVWRNSVKVGQTISSEEVSNWWAFRKLWKRVR